MQPAENSPTDFNPYAPPTIAEACLAPTTEVVGVWREASRLVLHRDYILPALCARTLLPADSHLTIPVNFWRTLQVRIPVSRQWIRRRWQLFFVYLLLSPILPLLGLSVVHLIPFPLVQTIFTLFTIGSAPVCLLLANDQLWPFTWARTRGPYIAIQGFSSAYLERLPAWPGLKQLQQPVER